MTAQSRLDLAQLDTVAAQLDLLVRASQIHDAPVGQPARQVARVVHACTRRTERTRQETLRRQARTVQIATRQASAGEVHFARHAIGHRLQCSVKQV